MTINPPVEYPVHITECIAFHRNPPLAVLQSTDTREVAYTRSYQIVSVVVVTIIRGTGELFCPAAAVAAASQVDSPNSFKTFLISHSLLQVSIPPPIVTRERVNGRLKAMPTDNQRSAAVRAWDTPGREQKVKS